MDKQPPRAKSRATNGGVLAGISAISALGGAAALAVPPASAMPILGSCKGQITTCVALASGQPTGPQLAPLPSSVQVRSIPNVADRPLTSVLATSDGGYRLTGSAGGVYSFAGSDVPGVLGQRLNGRIVGAAQSTSGGLWLAGSDGGVFAVNAPFYGSMGGHRMNAPIVAIAANPLDGGYLLAAADGGVFSFGAPFYGSMGGHRLSGRVVGMAVDPITGGYWLVGSDGGVFAFNAPFFGSEGGKHIGGHIVGIVPTPLGDGYWLVGSDGGVFSFGAAPYLGSLGGHALSGSIVGMAPTLTGSGYWLAGSDGGVFAFGDARYLGAATLPPKKPIPATPPIPKESSVVPTSGGNTGVDISRYQCGNIPNSHADIAVVQVSGGSFYGAPNPCYQAQAGWAGPKIQTYIYMDGLGGVGGGSGASGPAGTCGNDTACQAYNFGWNWTQHWVSYSNSVGVHPKKWWLDIEKDSGWTDPGHNNLIIRGAIAALRADGLPLGIYSNSTQWNAITGGLHLPGVDLWVPGAGNVSGAGYTAQSFCGDPTQAFAGGKVKYVQYGYTGNFPGAYPGAAPAYDLDYAC